MDYHRGGSNVIEIIPDSSIPNDHAMWATDDDYAPSADSFPPAAGGKKPRSETSNVKSTKAIGKMFFKTKLCCKFRAGTCPYITTCNFAHGMEELRKPPPNWQEIVAAYEESLEPPREEHQIPILTSSAVLPAGDSPRSHKGRHCKKFYSDEGCPYGEDCTFMHDEQSRSRESVAISLSPMPVAVAGQGGQGQKPSNWKTRICNKWEMTGYCPFGTKCHFAHGAAELHRYGGGLMEGESRDASSTVPDSKSVDASLRASMDTVVASVPTDVYPVGVPGQRSAGVSQRQGQRIQKWKGPNKISRIYGDWIDEND